MRVEASKAYGNEIVFDNSNFKAKVRFSKCEIKSIRSVYEISQKWGLDAEGKLSEDFVPFEANSVEALLLDFVKSGRPEALLKAGLIYNEVPQHGEISRNVSLYDPKTNLCYTVGGIGLIDSVGKKKGVFQLKDPVLNSNYHAFQTKRGLNPGGTCTVSDKGLEFKSNKSKLGVIEYQTGPYSIIRKMTEAQKVREQGINSPEYIAAGLILNLDKGQFGFSIYRSQLTPDYLPNLHLFLGPNASFTHVFQQYLNSKYKQLAKLHHELKESHGQPTATNALLEVKINNNNAELLCQIKDWATNTPLPAKTDKSITDGICEFNIGLTVKKSPYLAAMIYDLQLAITQDLNILVITSRALPNDQLKLNFIAEKSRGFIAFVVQAYGIEPSNAGGIANFALQHLVNSVQKGHPIEEFNRILGGLVAHAIYGFSKEYGNQIEVF